MQGARALLERPITRAQFEELVEALNPEMPNQMKRQLAQSYTRLLVYAHRALELGLDKDPRFEVMMKFSSLQILSQSLTREMQKKVGNTSEELNNYYKSFKPQLNEAYFATLTSSSGDSTADKAAGGGDSRKPLGEALPTRQKMIECINFYVGDLDKAKRGGVSVWEGLDYSAQLNAFTAMSLANDPNQQLLPNYYKAARQKYREIMTRAGLKFDPR